MILTLILFFVFAVVIAGIVVCFSKRGRTLNLQTSLWDSLAGAAGYGTVFFDQEGTFCLANEQAYHFFPLLDKSLSVPKERQNSKKKSSGLDVFLSYLYDNAIDYDESLGKVLERLSSHMSAVGFREVVRWSEGICLVEALKIEEGYTGFVIRDVGAFQRREEDLQRLSDYSFELMEAMEVATNGIVIIDVQDAELSIVTANKTFCDFVGIGQEDIGEESFFDIAHEVFDAASCEKMFAVPSGSDIMDISIQTKDLNEPKIYNLKMTSVKGGRGNFRHFVGIFTDITELRKHEAETYRNQKLEALGQLAAGVAHDFNNILSIVDGYAHLLAKRCATCDYTDQYADKIRVAARRGADLTRKMLTFSRHKIVVDEVVDMTEVIKEQESLLQPLVDASITLDINICSENCPVECTQETLMQIIMNLAVNARDAIEEGEGSGGYIGIKVERCALSKLPEAISLKLQDNLAEEDSAEEDLQQDNSEKEELEYACLSVWDDGAGMEDAVFERIFDPFFTTKEQGKGTGLGLSMVYGLVNEAGGHIDVDTELGRGTCFSIYLPISTKLKYKQIVGDPSAGVDKFRLEGYTALVADDETDLLPLVAEMLRNMGMDVLTAEDGDEALLRQEDYEGEIDLLLTDVVMPGLDGLHLAKLFEAVRPKTKIIFMSGYPGREPFSQDELSSEIRFIAKPVKYEVLAEVIYQTLLEEGDSSSAGEKAAHWQNVADQSKGV